MTTVLKRAPVPNNFDNDLYGDRTLLLGAPQMGKSEWAEAMSTKEEVELINGDTDSLLKTTGLSTESLIIIDDFYDLYQRASSAVRLEFREWLRSDRLGGVCLVTRPRDIDWLLCQPNEEVPITEAFLKQTIETVYFARYDRDQDALWNVYHTIDDTLTDGASDDRLDAIEYSGYSFDHAAFSTVLDIDEYPKTLAPGWLTALPANEDGRLLSVEWAGEAIDAIREGGENLGISSLLSGGELLRDAGEWIWDAGDESLGGNNEGALQAAKNVLTSERVGLSLPAFAAGGGIPPALLAAGSATLWLALRDPGPDSEALLDSFLDIEMTPATREQIEAAFDLPPRTLERLADLAEADMVSAVREVIDNPPAELREDLNQLEDRMDRIESEVEMVGRDLEDLRDDVNELRDSMQTLETIVDFRMAADDIDDLAVPMGREDEQLLGREGATADVDDLVAEYRGNEPRKIVQRVDDGHSFVVLKGPHGTGKTTAAYHALQQLQDRDRHAVRIPNLLDSSPAMIRRHIDRLNAEEVVLYTTYGRPALNEEIADQRDLRPLVKWVLDDRVATVIVECRSELYSRLDEMEVNVPEQYRPASDPWATDRTTIAFEPLDEESIRDYVVTLAERTGWEGDVDAATEVINSIARGTPEIAKLAARFAFDDERSIGEISTVDDLIRRDLQFRAGLFDPSGGKDTDVRKRWNILVHLSFVNRLSTTALADTLDLTPEELTEIGEDIQQYLGEDVQRAYRRRASRRESSSADLVAEYDSRRDLESLPSDVEWQIRPNIYSDVIFRYCLHEIDVNPADDPTAAEVAKTGGTFTDTFGHLFVDRDDDRKLLNLSWNLAVAYGAGYRRRNQPSKPSTLELAAVQRSKEVLNAVLGTLDTTPKVQGAILYLLSVQGVPIDPAVLDSHHEQIFAGMEAYADEIDAKPSVLMNNVLGFFHTSSLIFSDLEYFEGVADLTPAFAADSKKRYGFAPNEFLINLYAVAIAGFVHRTGNPDEVSEKITAVEERAIRIAGDPEIHDFNPAEFLENIYAIVISFLPEATADSGSGKSWLKTMEERAADTARDPVHDHEYLQFLENFYSFAISNLANEYTDPGDVTTWVERIDKRVAHLAHTHGDTNREVSKIAMDSYSMTVAELMIRHDSPDGIRSWIEAIENRALNFAHSIESESPHKPLLALYPGVVGHLVDLYSDPTQIDHWLKEIKRRGRRLARNLDVSNVSEERFLATIYALTIVENVEDQYPGTVGKWPRQIWNLAIEAATPNWLGDLYHVTRTVWAGSTLPLQWFLWLLRDVCERTVHATDPVLESREDRIHLVARVSVDVAYMVGRYSPGGFDSAEFRKTVRLLGSVAKADFEFFEDVVRTITESIDPQKLLEDVTSEGGHDDREFKTDLARFLARLAGEGLGAVATGDADVSDSERRIGDLIKLLGGVDENTTVSFDPRTQAYIDALDIVASDRGINSVWSIRFFDEIVTHADPGDIVLAYGICVEGAFEQNEPELIPWIVSDLLERTFFTTDPIVADRDKRREVQATVLVGILDELSKRPGFPTDIFDIVVETVKQVAEEDPRELERLVDAVKDMLSNSTSPHGLEAETEWRLAFR